MATGERVNGFALASILAGTILIYAGIKGISVAKAVQAVIQGKSPQTVAQDQPIDAISVGETDTSTGSGTSSTGGSNSGGGSAVPEQGSVEETLKATAATFGWTGAQWTCLYNVEMAEAGFNLTARNPSGAYGIAQFIRGPSEYAQYGGDSTTASGQSIAMCNYIKQRYETPCAAWAHEQAYHWY